MISKIQRIADDMTVCNAVSLLMTVYSSKDLNSVLNWCDWWQMSLHCYVKINMHH